MAEEEPSLPPRGKVQAVRQQWSVHEDGALAYQIQNEEFSEHYGFNRFNRRTVREDIPIAKVVQSEEEMRRQEERMRELEALRAQAEEDEKVAKKINDQLKLEAASQEVIRELDDEEIARQLQEKEKKRYEKHLEKKREKKLKQERTMLEAALAKDSEEARLALNAESGSANPTGSVESLDSQGVNITRVTPAGRIEDDGDFSDFYNLPPEMDEFTRLEIQASQDEELARLLQEQEHKRTKAEVDRNKLKRIELQDEQLARVMQEQEKLRLKKAKQRHQQKKEAKRQTSAENMPLGASANSLNQQKMPQPQISSSAVSAAVPIASPDNRGGGAGHHRYRRNSYTQAFDSPPSPPRSQPPAHLSSARCIDGQQQQQRTASGLSQQQYIKAQQQMSPPLSSSVSGPGSAYIGPGGGMSTLESARRIAAGDHERIMAMQNSQNQNAGVVQRGGSLQERPTTPRDGTHTMDIIRAHSHHGPTTRSGGAVMDPRQQGRQPPPPDQILYSQPYLPHGAPPVQAELRDPDAMEVQQWLSLQGSSHNNNNSKASRQSPAQQPHLRQHHNSGSGSYPSEEEDDSSYGLHANGPSGFNIAAAIDPTYRRRHPEASFSEETQLKSHIPFSRSLPQADGELEWDPGLRGSLRKTKAPIHGYQDSTTSSSVSHAGMVGGEPVMSSWQPVQGQRRGDGKSRNKARKSNSSGSDGKKDKGNCKQQ